MLTIIAGLILSLSQDDELWKEYQRLNEHAADLKRQIAELENIASLAESGLGPGRLEKTAEGSVERARKQAEEDKQNAMERGQDAIEKANKQSQEMQADFQKRADKIWTDALDEAKRLEAAAAKLDHQAADFRKDTAKRARYKKEAEEKRQKAKQLLDEAPAKADKLMESQGEKIEQEVVKMLEQAQKKAKSMPEAAAAEGSRKILAAEREAEKLRQTAATMREQGLPDEAKAPSDERRFREFARGLRKQAEDLRVELQGSDGYGGVLAKVEAAKKKVQARINKKDD